MSAEAGGGDHEWSRRLGMCNRERDEGLAESRGIGEKCPAERVNASDEPVYCGHLVGEECDFAECDRRCAEIECAVAERAAGQAVQEWMTVCHDAVRGSDTGAVIAVRSSWLVHARSGATS